MKKLKRVFALLGVILLLGMYGSTLVFALMDNPNAKGLLMASIYCTIIVPVFLYAILLAARVVRGNRKDEESGD